MRVRVHGSGRCSMVRWSRCARNDCAGRGVRAGAGVLIAGALLALALPAGASGRGASVPSLQPAARSAFDSPTSATVVGSDLYVSNGANNTVTEVTATSGARVAIIGGSAFGFDAPSAIDSVGSDLFVANGEGNSLT